MDMLYYALNDIQNNAIVTQKTTKQSIGLLHEKMQNRYRVVEVLPKKTTTLSGVFDYADAYGKIRLAYFGSSFKEATNHHRQNSFGSAIGGVMGIKSASFYNFGANIATYISQDLPFLYDDEKQSLDFLTTNGESFAYIALASIDYNSEIFQAKIGRFLLDTPYANGDDIRMAQNSFEGVYGNIDYTEKLSSQLFYTTRWAGFDSQDEEANLSQDEFKTFTDNSDGMYGISLSYGYNDESSVALWYYGIDKMADILYAEVNGVYNFSSSLHIDYGLQYSNIQEKDNSQTDGDVYGAMTILHVDDFFATLAYNKALVDANDSITDGFGGGPYFTSLDEGTIAAASEMVTGENINVYKLGVGYDVRKYYSSFEYSYGDMNANSGFVKEHDFIYTFSFNDTIQAQIVAITYKTKDNKLNRVIANIEYNF